MYIWFLYCMLRKSYDKKIHNMYCLFTGYFYDVVFNFARYSVPPKYDFLHLFAFYFDNLLVSTFMDTTQVRFTCSKTIIETLAKKVWNMFKVNNKNTRTTSLTSFWRFYCLLWTYFTPFTSVSINDFEQVMLAGYLHVFCIRKPFFFAWASIFLT